MYQRILVATDGSALSKKAVAAGIGLAALSGAELLAGLLDASDLGQGAESRAALSAELL